MFIDFEPFHSESEEDEIVDAASDNLKSKSNRKLSQLTISKFITNLSLTFLSSFQKKRRAKELKISKESTSEDSPSS